MILITAHGVSKFKRSLRTGNPFNLIPNYASSGGVVTEGNGMRRLARILPKVRHMVPYVFEPNGLKLARQTSQRVTRKLQGLRLVADQNFAALPPP